MCYAKSYWRFIFYVAATVLCSLNYFNGVFNDLASAIPVAALIATLCSLNFNYNKTQEYI